MAHVSPRGVHHGVRSRMDLLRAAVGQWEKNPLSYRNIRIDHIKVIKGKDFRGANVPVLYRSDLQTRALVHLAPWSRVKYARIGIHGNRGRPMYGSDDVRTHPRDLQFELMLDASPLGDDIADIANDEFLRYCSWLREIEAKYGRFILDNLNLFPLLEKRLEGLSTSLSEVKMRADMSPAVKCEKDEDGFPPPDTEAVMYQQKLFIPFAKGKNVGDYNISNEHDLQIAKDHRLLRKSVPFYDALGKKLPLEMQRLERDSFPICVESNVECMSFQQHYGLKLRPRKAVVLAEYCDHKDTSWSPYDGHQQVRPAFASSS